MERYFFTETILSLSFLSSLAVLGVGLLALVPLLAAGSALGLFRFGWQTFTDLFRILPEREKSWGTVYDAQTLRPVPFAVMSLLGADRRILEKRVADQDGRFGFLTTPSSLHLDTVDIYLDAHAPGYTFPSVIESMAAHVLYGQIYRGGKRTVNKDELVNVDVPMDPIREISEIPATKAPSVALGVATAAMADAGLWVGLLAVPLAFIIDPDPFSFGVLCVFLGVASMRVFGIAEHPFGVVQDARGRAVPFALLTVHDDEGQRVAYAVSDERGRYVMTVPRGSYVLTARTPANVHPPRETEVSLSPRKGWVTKEIII